MKAVFLVVLFFGLSYSQSCPQIWPLGITPLKWSDPLTWLTLELDLPIAGAEISLPLGVNLLFDLDDSSPIFNSITISAGSALYFDDSQPLVHLKSLSVSVEKGGLLQIGSPECLYQNKAVITLVGPYNSAAVNDSSIKSISVFGTLELHGPSPGVTWTHLAQTLYPGNQTISLTNPVDWGVGDQIVIASTDYDPLQSASFFITQKISPYTFVLDHPVQWTYWAGNNSPNSPAWDRVEKCEVGMLTRNILIQGDNQSDFHGFGGHVIGFYGSIQRIEGVEYTKMGMSGIVARYAVHWHFVGETYGTNQYLINSVMHDNYLRCATIHHTSSILVKNNVAFNTSGHCFYLEDGWEQNNTFDGNLAIMATLGNVVPTDNRPSMYWITNPNNTYINNVAVGGSGGEGVGFWFSLPASPIQLSYSTDPTIFPNTLPIQRFYNNTAHSTGWCVAIAENVDRYGNPQDQLYLPTSPSVIDTMVLYKCLLFSAWMRTDSTALYNIWMGDYGTGFSWAGARNYAQNITMVARTSNPAHMKTYGPIMGFEGYDSGGCNLVQNITCLQHFPTQQTDSACVSSRYPSQFTVNNPDTTLSQFSTPDGSERLRISNTDGDGPTQFVTFDQDGSWLGYIGGYAMSTSAILRYNMLACIQSGVYSYCPPFDSGYTVLAFVNNVYTSTNFENVTNGNVTDDVFLTIYGFGDTKMENGSIFLGDPRYPAGNYFQIVYPTNRGYIYRFPYATPSSLTFNYYSGVVGDWILVALPYPPGTTFTFTGWHLVPVQVSSVSALRSSGISWYYDSFDELLYVKYYLISQLSSFWAPGIANYEVGDQSFTITANCTSTCQINPDNEYYVPPLYQTGEQKYEVILCSSSQYVGKGYFSYNQNTSNLYYNIYHSIFDATSMLIGNLATNTPYSPSRGQINILGGMNGETISVSNSTVKASGVVQPVSQFGYNTNTQSICQSSGSGSGTTSNSQGITTGGNIHGSTSSSSTTHSSSTTSTGSGPRSTTSSLPSTSTSSHSTTSSTSSHSTTTSSPSTTSHSTTSTTSSHSSTTSALPSTSTSSHSTATSTATSSHPTTSSSSTTNHPSTSTTGPHSTTSSPSSSTSSRSSTTRLPSTSTSNTSSHSTTTSLPSTSASSHSTTTSHSTTSTH